MEYLEVQNDLVTQYQRLRNNIIGKFLLPVLPTLPTPVHPLGILKIENVCRNVSF